jgi:hypothetical protein
MWFRKLSYVYNIELLCCHMKSNGEEELGNFAVLCLYIIVIVIKTKVYYICSSMPCNKKKQVFPTDI